MILFKARPTQYICGKVIEEFEAKTVAIIAISDQLYR